MNNYDNVWGILEKYKFKVDRQISDYVTCVICHNLLIDACQAPCSCNYCHKCIVNYLENRELCCPGNNHECKSIKLSLEENIAKDIGANIRVSKLTVKCPLNDCSYEIKLQDMCDHLRVCDKRSMTCPFREIGCSGISIGNEKISDHFFEEISQHSKLLIDLIMNTRNEVAALAVDKQSEISRHDLMNLQQSIDLEITRIVRDNDEARLLTETRLDDLHRELRNVIQSNRELEKTLQELKENSGREIFLLKKKTEDQEKEISQMKKDFYRSFNLVRAEIRQKNKKANQIEANNSSDQSNSKVNLGTNIASFEWKVEKIAFKKKSGGYFRSDYFYSSNGEYKIWLRFYPNGCDTNDVTIECYVWNGIDNIAWRWPFDGSVTISANNASKSAVGTIIRKKINFHQPSSEFFVFPNWEFDSLAIECDVFVDE